MSLNDTMINELKMQQEEEKLHLCQLLYLKVNPQPSSFPTVNSLSAKVHHLLFSFKERWFLPQTEQNQSIMKHDEQLNHWPASAYTVESGAAHPIVTPGIFALSLNLH